VAVPALVSGAGAPGFFAVTFAAISYPLVFVALPRLWSVAHVHGFVTSAEFVGARFGSQALSTVVAVAAIVATIPYIAGSGWRTVMPAAWCSTAAGDVLPGSPGCSAGVMSRRTGRSSGLCPPGS
jgi:hypothetical protein